MITKPGVYDYEGTMHIWKGGGSCSVFGDPMPALEIQASNVEVKNFGVRGAKTGIALRLPPTAQDPLSSIQLVNLEVRACYRPLDLPAASKNLLLKDSILVTE